MAISEFGAGFYEKAIPSPDISVISFEQAKSNHELMDTLNSGCSTAFRKDFTIKDSDQSYGDVMSDYPDGIITYATYGNEIVGAGMTIHHREGSFGERTAISQELSHLYVLPEHRGKAIGHFLLNKRIRMCVSTGGNIWSVLERGEKQLYMYRDILDRTAQKAGRSITEWSGDPTTESSAYAYIENEDGPTIYFQQRTPNGPVIYGTAKPRSTTPKLSPDGLYRSGIIHELNVRKVYDDSGLSKSVGVTSDEFSILQDIVNRECKINYNKALDGGFPQVLSVTIV